MNSTVSRTQLLGLVLGLSLAIPSATAATIAIDAGSLTLVRSIVGGAETDDIRGLVTLAVSNPGPVGTVFLSDSTGGTDPGFATLPFGNAQLGAFSSGLTEVALFVFDFATLVDHGASATVSANLAGVLPNPLADPALSALTSTGKLHLDLTFLADLSQTPPDKALVYSLSSASITSIPEPSSLMLGGLGLVALLILKSRSRKTV